MPLLSSSLTRVIGLGCLVGLLAVGCQKKVTPPPSDPVAREQEIKEKAEKIPGANAVVAALDKKDYQGAVAALLQCSQNITTPEQMDEFTALKLNVKNALLDVSATDPKAAEALGSLRLITVGR